MDHRAAILCRDESGSASQNCVESECNHFNRSGAVQFKVGANNIDSPFPIVGGTASITTSSSEVGVNLITAIYTDSITSLQLPSDNLLQLVEEPSLPLRQMTVSRSYGQANGTRGYTITGFVDTDNETNSVTGTPLIFAAAIPKRENPLDFTGKVVL
jgi:hypothetical protein